MAGATPSHCIKEIKQLWGSVCHTNLPMWLLCIKSHNSLSILCSKTTHKFPAHSLEPAISLEDTTGLVGQEGMSFSRSSLWPIQEQVLTTEVSVNHAINFCIAQSRKKTASCKASHPVKQRWEERYLPDRPLLAWTVKMTAFTSGRITAGKRRQN